MLISGAGIAGPALAHWLSRYGFAPTIVERAPALRSGGYLIDFWGAGYDLVEKMGLLPGVLRAGYSVREVRIVDRRGRRAGGFDAGMFRSATGGRYTSLPRSELSAILFRSVEGAVETLFGNSIVGLEPAGDDVHVRFEHGSARRFDLVIGADGLHSVVRSLRFGPESRFERFLGYTVAAFQTVGYPHRDDDVYVGFNVPGRQIARFSMRGNRTLFLLVAEDGDALGSEAHDVVAQKKYLRERFSGAGWECAEILSALDRCDELYFDRVSQIRMAHWSDGRIGLVGDAAFAPSLLAGQGAALAIVGAYVLAGELARSARVEQGLARYQARLERFIADKQDAARGLAKSFAPATSFGIFVRNQVTKAFALPLVAKLAFGATLIDRFELPEYAEPPPSDPCTRSSRSETDSFALK